ncbi:MAG: succinate dehydrogenase cytochrome b subunit [Bdellovibrionota bacterium]|nr:succinate dehydrogenase cytochrome b subunit [Bdellovibrionota bacterium]
MSRMASYLTSTIGRKQTMGIAGLGLSVFVLTHMLGNLLIFKGPQAYNEYAHALVSNPAIYLAEAGLLGIFVLHAINAIGLKIRNSGARTRSYAQTVNGEKAVSFASKTMIHTGMVILIFTILHLITFKFGTLYTATYGDSEIRDLHRLVIEVFQSPIYVAWYILSLIALGVHLSHGVASAFKTLGFNHPRYNCGIETFSLIYGWIIALGFISQPVYVFFIHQ